jgi:hypothetical protein
MSKPSVMICLPAYGQSNAAQTTEALYTLAQFFGFNGIRNQLSWYSAADIVEVRNLFLTTWYDTQPQFSHLLFIDADMGFPPELIRDMIQFNKPLTGTFYARRQMTPSIVGATLHAEHSIKDVVKGFIPASYVGGGVMLIQRKMIKEMLEKMPHLSDALPSVLANATTAPLTRLIRAFDCILAGDRRLSEDVSFCARWRDCGGEIWANINHKISHVGPFDFHMRYQGVLEAKAAQAEQVEAAA